MKYLLLLTNTSDQIESREAMPAAEAQAARAAEIPKWNALFERMLEREQWLDGLELDTPLSAKVLRVRDGETVVTDGPYAETREQVGGFFLVECSDLDEAIELAALVPVAGTASVEIRPLVQ